ncbi:MAG: nucleotide sugar dehydrogenase [Candidatus Omnitrophica bacterium]|nr:nucleotide sugar dehydrogenase [Candidatus Omnitrophota bacterium]
MSAVLKKRIANRSAKIAVVGLGYVGLPLAVNFAKVGYRVFGLDLDQDRVNKLMAKESYILDIASKELAAVVSSGKLDARCDFSILKEADAVIICVPTPLKRKYTPDISYIVGAVRIIRKYLHKNMLIVLESTTYPGTTDELIKPELEKSGLKSGKDFYLSFSPERIDPGNPKYEVTSITKVVGGLTKEAGELTKALYEKIIVKIHMVSSARAAEMTKLLENTFRIINIGWANEASMMCKKLGIDIWEVIEAAKTKPFGFMPFYPGLGVGGHCIPDDPLYLYWKAKQYGFSSKYIKLSADINLSMPDYAIGRLADIFKARKKTLSKAKLLVMGVTYKKDVKDLRKSPPLILIEKLQEKCPVVDYYDPIIPYLKIGNIDTKSVEFKPAVLSKYDAVIIAADHTAVNYKLLLKSAKLIFDVKNVYGKIINSKVERF